MTTDAKAAGDTMDIAKAITASLENMRTGLDGSKGFAIVFVSTVDDGTITGGSAFGELSTASLFTLCMEAIKAAKRVSARGKCDCPICKAARAASQTTH